jgi:hypothetical protein
MERNQGLIDAEKEIAATRERAEGKNRPPRNQGLIDAEKALAEQGSGEQKPVEDKNVPGVTEDKVGVTSKDMWEQKVAALSPAEKAEIEKREGLESGTLSDPEKRKKYLAQASGFLGKEAMARDMMWNLNNIKLKSEIIKATDKLKMDMVKSMKGSVSWLGGKAPTFLMDDSLKPGVSGKAAAALAGSPSTQQAVPEFAPDIEKALYQTAVAAIGGMFQSLSPGAARVPAASVAAAGAARVGQDIQTDYEAHKKLVKSINEKNAIASTKHRGDVLKALGDLDKAYNEAEKFAITSSLQKHKQALEGYASESENHRARVTAGNKFLTTYATLATAIDQSEYDKRAKSQDVEVGNADRKARYALAAGQLAFKLKQEADESNIYKAPSEKTLAFAQINGLDLPTINAMYARSKALTNEEYLAVQAEAGDYFSQLDDTHRDIKEGSFWGFLNWNNWGKEERAATFLNNTLMLAGMGRFANFTALRPLLSNPDLKWNVDTNDVKILFPREIADKMAQERAKGRTILTSTHDDLREQLPRAMAKFTRLCKKAKEIDKTVTTPEEVKKYLSAEEAKDFDNTQRFLLQSGVMEAKVKRRGAMAKVVSLVAVQKYGSPPPKEVVAEKKGK